MQRACIVCGEPFSVRLSEAKQKTCGKRVCWNEAITKHRLRNDTELHRLCLAHVAQGGLSQRRFALAAQIDYHAYYRWMHTPNGVLSDENLIAIADLLGIPYMDAKKAAGGQTKSERMAAIARKLNNGRISSGA